MDRADCRNTEPSPFGLVVKLELLRTGPTRPRTQSPLSGSAAAPRGLIAGNRITLPAAERLQLIGEMPRDISSVATALARRSDSTSLYSSGPRLSVCPSFDDDLCLRVRTQEGRQSVTLVASLSIDHTLGC